MIKDKRKNFNIGGSKGITYPYVLVIGDESTLAGGRLLLVDPQGKISPELLLKFYERRIQPFVRQLVLIVSEKE